MQAKKVNMIPGQASANIKELKIELDNALKNNNSSLGISIIETLSTKGNFKSFIINCIA